MVESTVITELPILTEVKFFVLPVMLKVPVIVGNASSYPKNKKIL